MTLDAIKALDVPAADDCVLFLWATAPMLPEALEVMKAWGFTYKSRCVWVKDRPGTGYWFRDKAEELLVGVRGNQGEGDVIDVTPAAASLDQAQQRAPAALPPPKARARAAVLGVINLAKEIRGDLAALEFLRSSLIKAADVIREEVAANA